MSNALLPPSRPRRCIHMSRGLIPSLKSPPDTLKTSSGLHTYLGCVIETDGGLRLISYINPHHARLARVPMKRTA